MFLRCHVASITICVLASLKRSSGYYSSYDSSSTTNSQLRTVNAKLEILTNEVSRLADVTRACTDSKAPPVDPATLVAINRTPGPDGNIFTLHLIKNGDEIFFDISVKDQKIAASYQDEEPDGSCSFTFVCDGNCKSEAKVEVLLTNRNHSSKMSLELINSGTRALFQDRFTIPTLKIKHSGDLVYDEERDVDITVSASYGEEKGFSDLSPSLGVVILDTGDFQRQSGSNWIKTLDQKRFLETEETTLRILTSEHSVSGLLHLSVAFSDSDAPLVKTLKVERSIVLRPRDMDGPFPDSFLEFEDDGERDIYGKIQKKCQVGSSCTIGCTALGQSITGMELNKHLAEDEWEPVTDAVQFDFEYSNTLHWTVQATADSEDMTFRCIAVTAAKNSSQDIEVIINSQEFYIDKNRSLIEVDVDENQPGYENMTVTCTVVGRPVLSKDLMLFYGHDDYHLPRYYTPQVVTNRGETTLTATINFDPRWNRLEEFHYAECRASGDNRGDRYFLEWHPSSQD
ncbi:hypothetical protein RRG08_036404 [Elysia crispata]|uniref:Uncharacterized protein n=1 Tax=Elysia crispata TaxID=231223 RepID=A0AAE0ZLT1_9GAST|nr:hypothetical protein RRG08_036404 [Elysia crispata]